jgi:D-alanyl-D-alanine carboxypeptidase
MTRLAKAVLIAVAAACLSAVLPGGPAATPADTPEVRRLEELVAVVNTGDAAAMRAYLQVNSVDPRTNQWSSLLLPLVHDLSRLSTGVDLVRVTTIGPQQVQPQLRGYTVGILRNRATGDEQALAIAVEPEPPHRITGLPVLHPSLIATLVRPAASVARSEQEQLKEIGAYLKRLGDAGSFSGVAVIARDGEPVFSEAYGYADREKKVLNTLSTPFMLGSINKLFTGLAIGRLVEQGKISYDDPLSKFLPDFPDAESASRIRIKHLLSHTSGLGDYIAIPAYHQSLDRIRTVQALLEVAGKQRPAFEPGTKFAYSNTGFVVLGRVIEVVTEEDYYEHMAKHVFAPAGMTSASFPIYPQNGVANVAMAYPYEFEFDGERRHLVNKLGANFRRGSPSGVGLASALDLIALASALQAGRVVTPETLRLHSSPKPELGAPNYGYGFAVGLRRANDRLLVGHGGNAPGMCTEFGALQGTPYTLIVLSNLTIGTCVSVTGKILRVLAAQQNAAAAGTDWPQWRGPTRDGVVSAALPHQWPEALKKRWEIPVGAGHASPVVSGDRVVVIAREGDQEIVRALDLVSGKEIWRAAYPAPFEVNPAARSHGAGPKATPAIAGGRVFTLGISGILSAFDLAGGTLLWRVPAPEVLPDYGAAASPLIDGTSVIAHVGGYENGALTSFDAATGKPRWQWTGDGPGYGSPIIATVGGVRQVIAQTQKLLVGLDASNGTLLWQVPFTTEFDQNAFTPVAFQDLLIVGGIDWPLTAIRLKLAEGKWTVETAWTNEQAPMFMSSPVLVGGTIYGLGVRRLGQFVAVDAAGGKTLWSTQGREGENASILGSPSWLLASTTEGKLVVARASAEKYEEVRRYQIAESPVWAHPAITGKSIIVKDADKVICWSF